MPDLQSPLQAHGAGVSSDRRAAFTVPGLDMASADEVIDLLDEALVALNDLSLTLKHIHWNVVGPNFIAVHQMLDPHVEQVRLMVDDLAERMAALGGSPNGLAGYLAQRRTWNDYSINRATAQAHLAALDLVYTNLIAAQRDRIHALEQLDPVSHSLLLGQSAQLEQQHWFVRAHLEDSAGGMQHAGTVTERAAAAKIVNRSRAVRSTG
jgi:starvation-inducible DNA-binding protein